jgi:hypothetical protein
MREIEGSKRTLEERLGRKVDGFAYPFGERETDFGDREVAMAKAAGYRVAFAASGGLTRRSADPWCLPRVSMGQAEMPHFRFGASGARSLLRRR